MNHYCTYCDRHYLAQALALTDSLWRHDPGACIWILSLDEEQGPAWVPLSQRPGVKIVSRSTLLAFDPDLALAVRSRTPREAVFTVTASWIRYLFLTQSEIGMLAYVDADLWFFSAPESAWRELGDGSVLVAPHDFPSWHDDSRWLGRFNVGWLLFRRDEKAAACLNRWREQCFESCALEADGRLFGDQKYLDDWPAVLGGSLRISEHPGVNLAPWNWAARRSEVADGRVTVKGGPVVCFHFAQFRPIAGDWWDSGQLEYGVMPRSLARALYAPYAQALCAAGQEIAAADSKWLLPRRSWKDSLGGPVLALYRRAGGQFWRIRGSDLMAPRLLPGTLAGRLLGAYRRWQRR